jgi:hypothetical protein
VPSIHRAFAAFAQPPFRRAAAVLLAWVAALSLSTAIAQEKATPSTHGPCWPALDERLFPDTTYRAAVPTGESLLGFPSANARRTQPKSRSASRPGPLPRPTYATGEYARTHEDRPLHYLIVTAPKNLSRLEEIQASMARLGDPRKPSESEAKQLIETRRSRLGI